MNTADEKRIRIRISAIKRMKKEIDYYTQEIDKIMNKIETMESDNPSDYAIKKWREMLEETITTKAYSNTTYNMFIRDLRSVIDERLESGDISRSLLDEIDNLD
jgi:hypothetical protein